VSAAAFSPPPTRDECQHQFSDAMREAGLAPPDRIEPGALHRFPGQGKSRGNRAGWCKLFPDGTGGVFGDWSAGLYEVWQAQRQRPQSAAGRAQFRALVEAARREREAEEKARRKEARDKAVTLWNKARIQVDAAHPYLINKTVRAYGIRQLGDALVIPLRDTTGQMHGLQFVAADGSKIFGTGTAKAGHYHAIGEAPDEVLAICEGYATAASIHAATDWLVAVAFDAGNLKPVAMALRDKYPSALFLICADNDRNTVDNIGLTKGREVARQVGGILLAPSFHESSTGTDWNDHAKEYGLEATGRVLLGVLREVRHVA
jgi:putative DNA primase/helicase